MVSNIQLIPPWGWLEIAWGKDGRASSRPTPFKIETDPAQGKYTLTLPAQRAISFATMSAEEENSQVFKGTTKEDVRLENLGYEQGESSLLHQYIGEIVFMMLTLDLSQSSNVLSGYCL